MIVLMLNDYPIGVYTANATANYAELVDWRRREPKWEEQGLKFGESLYKAGCDVPFMKWHYRQYDFVPDTEPKL